MLARVASSLYWIGRYIERSEHLTRYLRVQYFSILDTPMSQNKEAVLKSILQMYGTQIEDDTPLNEQDILVEVGFNNENPISLLSTVLSARENARSVRYLLSRELWEVINQYYLFVKEYSIDFYKTRGLYDFTINSGKHCSIVRSYLDHTLIHDDIWVFIELGIYLERAIQIVRILISKLIDIDNLSKNEANLTVVHYQWTITLKVLEAFDMHRRIYKKVPNQRSVVNFLTGHEGFPRSVAYNLHKVHRLISQLNLITQTGKPLLFKAGKLSSSFQYLEYEEIEQDLSGFLNQSLTHLYELNGLIEETYFQSIS